MPRAVLSALLLAVLGASPAGAAPPTVSMWFDDAELSAVAAHVAASSGRNLLLPSPSPLAGKRVTLLVPAPVTPARAWELLLSALQVHGLTASCHGAVVEVVPASTAAGAPGCAD